MRNYLMIEQPTLASTYTEASVEFIEQLTKDVDVKKFDLHVDLEDMLQGLPSAFLAGALNTSRWWLDQQIKNAVKQIARSLPETTEHTIDTFSDVQNALQAQWLAEEHTYEAGYEMSGPLHSIAFMRSARPVWIAREHSAYVVQGKLNPQGILTLESQIGMPTKQVISQTQITNFEMDALRLVKGLSDVRLRGEFRDGISMGEELMAIEKQIRKLNPTACDEQVSMYCEQNEQFNAILVKRKALSPNAITALNHRYLRIVEQEALFDKWYEAEVALIERQIDALEFTTRFMSDDTPKFWELPAALQTTVLDGIITSLNRTLSRYTSKSTALYSTYSTIIQAINAVLQNVIQNCVEDASHPETVGVTDAYQKIARREKRAALKE